MKDPCADCRCPTHRGERYTGNYNECDTGYNEVYKYIFIWKCQCKEKAPVTEG